MEHLCAVVKLVGDASALRSMPGARSDLRRASQRARLTKIDHLLERVWDLLGRTFPSLPQFDK